MCNAHTSPKFAMSERASEAGASTGLDQQNLAETLLEHFKQYHKSHLQIVQLLQQLRDRQKEYHSLRRDRWGSVFDIRRVARELWENPPSTIQAHSLDNASCMDVEMIYLKPFLPDPDNLLHAKDTVTKWIEEWYYQLPRGPANAHLSTFFPFQMHQKPTLPKERITYGVRHNIEDPFIFYNLSSDSTENSLERVRDEHQGNMCGIIAQFYPSYLRSSLDREQLAIIMLFLSRTRFSKQFLARYMGEWWELPTRARYYSTKIRESYFPDERFLMHHMRSFAVLYAETPADSTEQWHLASFRQRIAFKSFYTPSMSNFIEKRYSTAITFVPAQTPSGFYALVSICDHEEDDNIQSILVPRPADSLPESFTAPWKQYDIHPAGLFAGLSIFQLQICMLIDSWEQDWILTVQTIDRMVSLNLDVLEDNDRLRNLVLGNSADASVLYFKVLQILNNFSDMVGAASSSLETTSNEAGARLAFKDPVPAAGGTKIILEHNWGVVRQRQRDASDRILAKLARTSNEVKSLQSGLFNVQSITEARKSRILNKYLTVFTVVTILFLPPTFVATFFGMHIFDADMINTTQRIFWVVLAAVSGGTYLISGFGLFGSHFSTEERKEWRKDSQRKVDALRKRLVLFSVDLTGNLVAWLVAWFKSILRQIKDKVQMLRFIAGDRRPTQSEV
ncbi:hypothetical protein F5Y14DRAFT_304098 [Nemania sp. NC0429]|nr:hypothetical protein F5Y14DRAFT_304098 [Nemania sp. NC0429]